MGTLAGAFGAGGGLCYESLWGIHDTWDRGSDTAAPYLPSLRPHLPHPTGVPWALLLTQSLGLALSCFVSLGWGKFWVLPCGAQGLLLTLLSGIPLGGVWEDYRGVWGSNSGRDP